MSNMVVRTNIYALNSHRNMKNVGLQQKQASNRLSSGYRINSAADDAAGLAISENMRAQIRGLDQASRNAQDGQAMILTTEGGLEEIGNMLQRTRELLVQASNDTNTQNQRSLIDQEVGQLGREILSMQNRVEFNTNRVLAMGPGMTATVMTQASKMSATASNLDMASAALSEMASRVTAAIDILNELDLASSAHKKGAAADAITKVYASITANTLGTWVSQKAQGDLTLLPTNTFTSFTRGHVSKSGNGSANLATTVGTALSQLNSRLASINARISSIATVAGGDLVRTQFTTQSNNIRAYVGQTSTGNNVAFFQVGANASQGINFDFEKVSKAVAGAGWTVNILASAMSAPGAGSGIGNGVRVSPYISALDQSINDISTVRANLGAVQNRMDYTMRSLDISSENLSDSESRVRNADIAKEMMKFTMANVLQQASVSMLSQANQMPNNLLQLLR